MLILYIAYLCSSESIVADTGVASVSMLLVRSDIRVPTGRLQSFLFKESRDVAYSVFKDQQQQHPIDMLYICGYAKQNLLWYVAPLDY